MSRELALALVVAAVGTLIGAWLFQGLGPISGHLCIGEIIAVGSTPCP